MPQSVDKVNPSHTDCLGSFPVTDNLNYHCQRPSKFISHSPIFPLAWRLYSKFTIYQYKITLHSQNWRIRGQNRFCLEARGDGGGKGRVTEGKGKEEAQTMCTHMNKCKNNFKKYATTIYLK
jgi:hypothetical protein